MLSFDIFLQNIAETGIPFYALLIQTNIYTTIYIGFDFLENLKIKVM